MSFNASHWHSRKKASILALLLTMVLLGVFPLDVVLPSFPDLSSSFQVSQSSIAFSLSLFAMTVAMSQLIIGPLSDRIGRKPLLVIGILLAMSGALACTIVQDYAVFLFCRTIQAIGCGCFVLANALVQDIYNDAERDRVRIIIGTASGVFISLSPLAGTFLQRALEWQGSFYVFSALALLVLFQTKDIPPLTPSRKATSYVTRRYVALIKSSSFLGNSVVVAIAFSCHFSFVVISPVIFLDLLRLSQFEYSLILLAYGAAYLGGGFLAMALGFRLARHKQITAGLLLIGLAGVGLMVFNLFEGASVAGILIPMVVATTGTTITRPAATSAAMEVFPEQAGTASALLNTLTLTAGGAFSALLSLASVAPGFRLGLSFLLLSGVAVALARVTHAARPVEEGQA
ncbi:MFS transporter [Pseudomonas sp. v388]|uniref:MFS transporter n=1 Tax=Pseudomonas sp. v388 TaxID=2479849 RepID=UPI000F76B4F2|nr:MFS transporter [Pseudomonas sp. v388]RRV04942.1 MFS transporter [Pseudomonas sp. v388]